MERIVLAYDGSAAAVAALQWTAARCRRSPAEVDVITVVSSRSDHHAPAMQRLADAEALLGETVPGLRVQLHRLEGVMSQVLGDFARDVDLVVTGIHPARPVPAAVTGSRAVGLAPRGGPPVCMVPAGAAAGVQAGSRAGVAGGVPAGDQPITVGVARDGSSDSALAFASREARTASTGIRVVHAWLMPEPDASRAVVLSPGSAMARHRAVLDDAVDALVAEHAARAVQGELIRDSPSAALLKFAGTASMLVIGTHRPGFAAGGTLGAVAEEVMWHANCPVCVVPDDARR